MEVKNIVRITGDMEYDIDEEYEEGTVLFIDGGTGVINLNNITTNVDVVISAHGIVTSVDIRIRTSKNLIILNHIMKPMIHSINVWGSVIFLENIDTFKIGSLSIGKNLLLNTSNDICPISAVTTDIDGSVYANIIKANSFIGKKVIRQMNEEHTKEIDKWNRFIKVNTKKPGDD